MWKYLFEFLNALSCLLIMPRFVRWFRFKFLFDYKKKQRAIYAKFPKMRHAKMKLTKGGGSLAFIFDDKYVFKVRKHPNDDSRFAHEKRITDAIAGVLKIRVPHIKLIESDGYLFYVTDYIPGVNLMSVPLKRIRENNEKLGKQLADVIYDLYNANLPELADMYKAAPNTGLTHGDMCSNIIVNPKTLDLVGIIDWEWAGFNTLRYEFFGVFRVRRKMRLTDIGPIAMWHYYNHAKQK